MFGRFFKKPDGGHAPFDAKPIVPPWEPEFRAGAEVLMKIVFTILTKGLRTDKGIHAETLMTTLGALTGFSAQFAIRETYVKTGRLPLQDDTSPEKGAFVVIGKGGETYFFGDLLNSFLVPTSSGNSGLGPDHHHTLSALVAGGVRRCGGTPLTRDDIGLIFMNAAQTVGTPEFGAYRMHPQHRPGMSSYTALNSYWPGIQNLNGLRPGNGAYPALPPIHWPLALGMVTQEFIVSTKDVLSPLISSRLVMEAAIPMSKIDPKGLRLFEQEETAHAR